MPSAVPLQGLGSHCSQDVLQQAITRVESTTQACADGKATVLHQFVDT